MLHDEEGREVGTVGFATTCANASGSKEALQQAYDELESRVEERTTRAEHGARAVPVSADRHARDHLHDAGFGRIRLHLRQRECGPIMGFSPGRCLRIGVLVFAFASGRCPRVAAEMALLIERGGGNLEYRFRNRAGNYIWIQDTFEVHPRRERPTAGACWLQGGYFTTTSSAEQALGDAWPS